jgi:hypothetical protein
LFPADNVGRYGSLGYLRRQPWFSCQEIKT